MASTQDDRPRVVRIAAAVRFLMDKKGLTTKQVADSMGVSRARVAQLISGQHPIDKSIPGLAKAVGVKEATVLREAGL